MKNIFKFENFLLLIVIIIAIFFRFYNLSIVPPSPSLDEVSIGYNAYSILKTGMDEYGTKFPILLRAYDDWRPAFYVYLVVPFIKLFGLSVLSVRLPSVILSTISVVCVYFLTKEILRSKFFLHFDRKSTINLAGYIKYIPLIAAFCIAVSPWNIYISRLGHEANAAYAFLLFGLLFFLRYINNAELKKISKNNINLVLSSIFLSLSFVSYQTGKITVPILIFILTLLFYKILLLNKKLLILCILISMLILIPVFIETFKPEGLIRFSGTNIFTNQPEKIALSTQRLIIDKKNFDILGILFDNRRVILFLTFINAFLSHFNPAWLFTNQLDEPFKIPDFGLFNLIDVIFLFFGIYMIIKNENFSIKLKLFFLFWLIGAILPGALTTGYPHAMRSYNLLPLPQIVESFGVYYILQFIYNLENKIIKKFFLWLFALTITLSILWLFHSYFYNFPRELSSQFQYGVLNAFSYAKKIDNQYSRIVVSNQNNLTQSYMFYLFGNQIDPIYYINNGGTGSGRLYESHAIGKYQFINPEFDHNDSSNTLYIVNPNEFPEKNIVMIKDIKFLDGKDSVWIVRKK